MEKRNKYLLLTVVLLVVIITAGCAATVSAPVITLGFWAGLWHGMISPITFIISLFNSNVAIYAVGNLGHLYDFGFMFGTGGIGSLIRLVIGLITTIIK